MADQPNKDEKTEEATQRRLEEGRDRGQVAFSTEVMAALTLAGSLLALVLSGRGMAESAGGIVVAAARRAGDLGSAVLGVPEFNGLVRGTVWSILPAFLVLVLPVLAVAALVGYVQVGFRIVPKAVAFDPGKLDPIKGLQRMFSLRAFMRTSLSAGKIVLIMGVVGVVVWSDLLRVGNLAGADLRPVLVAVGRLLLRAALAGVIVILALGLFDLWFQRQQFKRDMMMTRKEIKDEHKTSDGDPLVKSRIRQLQREMASRRMMADVPDATVVVTNPEHYAVAVKYEQDQLGAPRVVAKGVDEVAQNIKRIAREAGVTVYEDPPLARALHRQVEIGDEIPEDLFQAVAGVLAYIYRLQGAAGSA